ncbi:MAG: HipA domain-containing protein [Ignavibacteriaceae bacterium]|jgi:serine/threonine-protein kinase HipA|nr:HipA domain-containing protein [Ignavibacteriaceae bacterium]
MVKTDTRKEIFVYADWKGVKNNPALMGVLYSEILRGKEIFSFEYSDEWLKSKFAQVIDPDLQLFSGTQYLNAAKNNFGIFLDSSPDRWGRVLMNRREVVIARSEKRKAKTLMESDYLLGVYDENRIGALRFKLSANGDFLNQDKSLAAPPITSLSELQKASLQLETSKDVIDDKHVKWLNMLIAPGSSLGGARPKASIKDKNGNLWIAKFPSANDNKDVGGWEMVVHTLAVKCGLNIAEAKTEKLVNKYHTFLVKRFDRDKSRRIHFASAMTLLGYTDNRDEHAGVSYLELAEFLGKHGARVNEDLEELWKRIVFNISVSNTDDHLRNHGFILTEKGWLLSPAYDINPNEQGTGLSLNISDTDNSLEYDLTLEVAEYFRLKKVRAEKIIKDIKSKTAEWKSVAKKFGIPKSEQLIMEKAFRVK